MSLQEECDEIQQAVIDNDVTTLKEMITDGVNVNGADVYDENEVSDIVYCVLIYNSFICGKCDFSTSATILNNIRCLIKYRLAYSMSRKFIGD